MINRPLRNKIALFAAEHTLYKGSMTVEYALWCGAVPTSEVDDLTEAYYKDKKDRRVAKVARDYLFEWIEDKTDADLNTAEFWETQIQEDKFYSSLNVMKTLASLGAEVVIIDAMPDFLLEGFYQYSDKIRLHSTITFKENDKYNGDYEELWSAKARQAEIEEIASFTEKGFITSHASLPEDIPLLALSESQILVEPTETDRALVETALGNPVIALVG